MKLKNPIDTDTTQVSSFSIPSLCARAFNLEVPDLELDEVCSPQSIPTVAFSFVTEIMDDG